MTVRGLDCDGDSRRASGQKGIQGEKRNVGTRSQSLTPIGEGKRCWAGGSVPWIQVVWTSPLLLEEEPECHRLEGLGVDRKGSDKIFL